MHSKLLLFIEFRYCSSMNKVWWPFVAILNLNLHCNHIYTTILHWNFKPKSRTKSIFNIISTTHILLIWIWIVLWVVYWLTIFNNQIKNGNLKLCASNGPSWLIAAVVFCRTRIRLKNPSFSYSYQFMPYSLIKIQDTKIRWVLRNLLINGNFEHFKNVF